MRNFKKYRFGAYHSAYQSSAYRVLPLQHLLQASCYKAKRRISLLTDLLTRVLLTDAILR